MRFSVHCSLAVFVCLNYIGPWHNEIRNEAIINCKQFEADVLLVVDVSGTAQDTIVLERTFIQNIITMFNMAESRVRLGFIIFSRICKTMVRLQDGINQRAVLEAIKKPWFPLWNSNMSHCIKQIRDVDLKTRPDKRRSVMILLVTHGSNVDDDAAVAQIAILQGDGVKFFLLISGNKASDKLRDRIGQGNIINVKDMVNGTLNDTALAGLVFTQMCTSTCQVKPDIIRDCAWNQQHSCVKIAQHKPIDATDPACKSYQSKEKSEPCDLQECVEPCLDHEWGHWDKDCCASATVGETFIRTRQRVDLLANMSHPTLCLQNDTKLCTATEYCPDILIAHLKAEHDQRQTRFMIYTVIVAVFLLLAICLVIALVTSRRRSRSKFQRRLKAAGVAAPLEQILQDERNRSRLGDLVLVSQYNKSMLADLPAGGASQYGKVSQAGGQGSKLGKVSQTGGKGSKFNKGAGSVSTPGGKSQLPAKKAPGGGQSKTSKK